ncbi:MAG: hypothetical protein ACYTXI_42300, partial [Nostoc sp.]
MKYCEKIPEFKKEENYGTDWNGTLEKGQSLRHLLCSVSTTLNNRSKEAGEKEEVLGNCVRIFRNSPLHPCS